MYTPRPYQQSAHDAVMNWWRHTTSPCVIEAATGAGKSHIIAMLAESLHKISKGKRVLCLAPSAELVRQNADKYLATGAPCSIYSASISKSLRHPVIFATEGTFKGVAKRLGHEFAGVVIDECHRLTNTVKDIIEDMKEGNPNLRVCGLSATPYRLSEGFVFSQMPDGKLIPESCARDPYFTRLVYYIGAPELIGAGFLTPPVIGSIGVDEYDTSGLVVQKNGHYSKASVDQAFEGWGRKTSDIVADVIGKTRGRMGVMIFASTVRHAEEIMASLPPDNSRMIGGTINTKKADRNRLIEDFKARRFKYFVNVNILTVGFDAPHVDAIAILRATESVSLLQQIIGRALRKHPDKKEALILDYSGSVEKHCPDGDLFSPEIKAAYQGGERPDIEAACEYCNGINIFTARKNNEGLGVDSNGYFIDLCGERVNTEENPDKTPKFMPAHYGRRCTNQVKHRHEYQRCSYYWTGKDCQACGHKNDIAARYCEVCKNELIDPATKLRIDFKRFKKDPTQIQTDRVIDMDVNPVVTRSGKECLVANFVTEWRSFSVWLHPEVKGGRLYAEYIQFMDATMSGVEKPETVTYHKDTKSGFYNIHDYGRQTDEVRAMA